MTMRYRIRQGKYFYGLHGLPIRFMNMNVTMIVLWLLEISIRTFNMFTGDPILYNMLGFVVGAIIVIYYIHE